ncbi:hypothetical protein ACFW1A_17490 [Kitasatospora sp. NPDC058965]|uniref:hypothetical protein n=1 Tax=Kitasatospora sp. NPDC058965 TaxID=3346682 RepID=UPI00368F7669
MIATPLAALSGAGLVQLWRAHRQGGPRSWALPAAVAGTAAWGAYLARLYPGFLPWLAPATLVLGLLAVLLLGAARTARFGDRRLGRLRVGTAALLASLCAVLLAPGAWAASVLEKQYGNSGMGTVGPQAAQRYGRPTGARPGPPGAGAARTAGRTAGAARTGGGGLDRAQQRILAYTRAHDDGARYLFATTSWSASSPYILATGEEVLPMGGFTGQVPSPTLAQVQDLVRTGRLRFVLLGDGGRGAGAGGGGAGGPARAGATGPTAAVVSWVRGSCAPVAPRDYGQSPDSPDLQLLYRCTT